MMGARLRAVLALALLLPPAATGQADSPMGVRADLERWSFELGSDLARDGWSVEGDPAFALRDAGDVVRGSAGGVVATGTRGRPYQADVDTRLVSPVIDLRGVPGADAAPLEPLRDEPSVAWSLDDARNAYANATPWPPSSAPSALDADTLPSPFPDASRAPRADGAVHPEAGPRRVGDVILRLQHAWDLAPGDEAFVELRARDADGAWSSWSRIHPALLEDDLIVVDGIARAGPRALDDGEAFRGQSPDLVESAYRLDEHAGRLVQLAFRLVSKAPLAPEGFGWALDGVAVSARLGAPDLAIVGFRPADAASTVPLGRAVRGEAVVRNWGAATSEPTTLLVEGKRADDSVLLGPAILHVPRLAPGARAHVPFPEELSSNVSVSIYLRARLSEVTRADVDRRNDEASSTLRFADIDALRISLSVLAEPLILPRGASRVFDVEATNVGNVARAGRVELFAARADLGGFAPIEPMLRVASAPLQPPPVSIARGFEPPAVARASLAWTPDARGAYLVEARWSGGGAASPPFVQLVDVAPSPLMEEGFARSTDAARPFLASSPRLLDGWAFDSWSSAGAPDAPEAPTGTRVLAGYVADEGDATRRVAGSASSGDDAVVVLPPLGSWTIAGDGDAQAPPIEVSYEQVLLATGRVDDPASRSGALSLQDLLNATVALERAGARRDDTVLSVGGGSISRGPHEGGALYVVIAGSVRPGVDVAWGPLTWTRGNETGILFANGSLREYVSEGDVRCCVVGPLRAEHLAPSSGPANAPIPRVVTRDLADFAPRASGEGCCALTWEQALQLEPGERATAELRTRMGVLLGSRSWGTSSAGWTAVAMPLPAHQVRSDVELRLSLSSSSNRTTPVWLVDSLRLLNASGPEAVVLARDDVDDEAAGARWSVDPVSGGWRLMETGPSPFTLRNGTLSWTSRADSAPSWAIARTPALDLGRTPAPQVTFRLRHDLGSEAAGQPPAAAAVVARVLPSGDRHLLVPRAGDGAYAGAPPDVLDDLARRLGVTMPRDAVATAWVGSSGWMDVTLDIGRLPREANSTVELELHAVSRGGSRGLHLEMDDLRVGTAGPAHDLALLGFPQLGARPRVGNMTPVPLLVEIADRGLLAPEAARVEVAVHDAAGRPVFPVRDGAWSPARVTLDRIGGTLTVAPAEPWTPNQTGRYRVSARVVSEPADELAQNDEVILELEVLDLLAASLEPVLVLDAARVAQPIAPIARVENRGTLPLRSGELALTFDVSALGGGSALSQPLTVPVPAIRPGENASVHSPPLWTPAASGAYLVTARLAGEDIRLEEENASALIIVRESLAGVDASSFAATGLGWTNSTVSSEPAWWTYVATPGEGELRLAPLDLTTAANATLTLRHDGELELGFDGVRLEVARDGSPWEAIEPLEGYPAAILPPHPLGEGAARAWTGPSGGEARFDLAQASSLRERRTIRDGLDGARPVWLGPLPRGNDSLYAPPSRLPVAPDGAVGHEARAVVSFRFAPPPGTAGELRIVFEEWRQLGDASRVEVASGAARVVVAESARTGTWTTREARLPIPAGETLVEVRHLQVSLRDGSGALHADHGRPHGGVALANVRAFVAHAGEDVELARVGEPATSESARWLLHDASSLPAPAPTGFAPLRASDVFVAQEVSWRAVADAEGWNEGRLAFPVDLTLAVGNVTASLDGDATLTAGSTLALAVSADGGRTWEEVAALSEELSAGIDLSAHAGRPVLLALRASFSTRAAAAEDVIEIRALRVEADTLRGGLVHVRLRGVSDADGTPRTWSLRSADVEVLRHGPGTALRLLAPTAAPITEGYRSLVFEASNRGRDPAPPSTLVVEIHDPAERGGATHRVQRAVSALAPGERRNITIRGADANWYLSANASPARVDALLVPHDGDSFPGDDSVVVAVGGANVKPRSLVVPLALHVEPDVVELASKRPVTFRVRVANDGEDAASMASSALRVYRGDELVRTLTNGRPATLRLDAGGTADVTWTWTPSGAMPVGAYRVVAEIGTASTRGSVLAAVESPFLVTQHARPEAVRIETFHPGHAWSCGPEPPCARDDPHRNASAPASLALGTPTSSPGASATVLVHSPEFPVRPGAPAVLRMNLLHQLPSDARVLAAPVSAAGVAGPWVDVLTLRGASAGWRDGRFTAVETNVSSRVGDDVRGFILRIEAPRGAAAETLWIDDVSVSPLLLDLVAPGRVALPDAVEKRIRMTVRNGGGLGDTLDLRLADADGKAAALPPGWSARVTPTQIHVPRGESRHVDVLLRAPPSVGGAPLRGEIPMVLLADSELLPGVVARATLDVRANGEPRPDVHVMAIAPRGASEPPGRVRMVDVAIANEGLAPASVAVTLRVAPPASALAPMVDVAATEPGPWLVPPGGTRVVSFVWTPAHPGAHTLQVALDPLKLVVEADRSDNTLETTVEVPRAPFVDLRTELRLGDASLVLGRSTAFRIEVWNRGAVVARSVEVTATQGASSLLDASPLLLGDIPPGASSAIQGNWTPLVPGDARIVVAARVTSGAPEPVETLADNAAVLRARVREGSIRIVHAGGAPLAPRFLIENLGNSDERLTLAPRLPPGWAGALEVGGTRRTILDLAAGANATATLLLVPADDALAGDHEVSIRAAGATAVHVGHARAVVAPRGAVDVRIVDATIDPRAPALVVEARSDANAPERMNFIARGLPEGWSLQGSSMDVPARGSARARLALDIGNGSRPLDAAATLFFVGERSQGARDLALHVPRSSALALEIDGEGVAGGRADVRVSARNEGNVPAVGLLELRVGEGAPEILALDVRPGASATFDVRLDLPPTTRPGLAATARAEGTVGATAKGLVRVLQRDLALDRVSPTLVMVTNEGEAVEEGAALELLLAGVPRGDLAVPSLVPGASAEVDLPALPDGDVVVRLRPGRAEPDVDPTDDALAWGQALPSASLPSGVPASSRVPLEPGLVLVAFALLAFARRGRRRE